MKTFSQKALDLARRIPKGRVTTYSEIARALGKPQASRAVGSALNRNKHPDKIPCHRVVRADGSAGGYSGGIEEKMRRLRNDGILIRSKKLDLKRHFHPLRRKPAL